MLTNFTTIKKRIALMEQLEARQANGDFERMSKKEAAKLQEELTKLSGTLGGIRKMKRLPGLIFIVDPHRERIAVTEANKLEIPLVGTGDTNVDPDELTYVIPGNDDAIRSIRLLCSLVAEAAIEGGRERAARAAVEPEPEVVAAAEPELEAEAPSDALVAALAGGAALTFEPDADDDDLLPGARAAAAAAVVADPVVGGDPRRDRRRDGARGRRADRGRGIRRCAGRRPRRGRDPADPRLTRRTLHEHSTAIATAVARHGQEHRTGMADISAQAVKELRERTGAGFMDCKRALEETGGDVEAAVALLRERGQAAAAKKAGRDAREGLVEQLHPHRRPDRRPDRGELRDGLRGPHRPVPEARPGPRHAGRRDAPGVRRRGRTSRPRSSRPRRPPSWPMRPPRRSPRRSVARSWTAS